MTAGTEAASSGAGRRGPRWAALAAVGAVRRAPRAVVVREVILQVVAAGLTVAAAVGEASTRTVLLVLVTAVVLLARLRWPALATLCVGGLLPFSAPGLWLASALSAFSAGRRESDPRRLWSAVAAAALLCLAVTGLPPGPPDLLLRLAVGAVGATLLLVVPALCGALVGQRRPAARLLAERNAYLERARALTVEHARWEERGRIAADMHDVLGHRLSLLAIHAGALEVRAGARDPELGEQALLVRTSATAALDELRATLTATGEADEEAARDVLPGGGGAPGSEAAVRALVEHWREAGADVEVVWDGAGPEPSDPRVGRAVDRTVREGLTNAHKHALGAAVRLTVARSPQQVAVTVVSGAPDLAAVRGPGNGLGLLGLAERARLIGGRAVWGPSAGGGFALSVEVPARPPSAPPPSPTTVPPAASLLAAPPQVRPADVLTWRRVAVVVVLAVLLPLAVTLTATPG